MKTQTHESRRRNAKMRKPKRENRELRERVVIEFEDNTIKIDKYKLRIIYKLN